VKVSKSGSEEVSTCGGSARVSVNSESTISMSEMCLRLAPSGCEIRLCVIRSRWCRAEAAVHASERPEGLNRSEVTGEDQAAEGAAMGAEARIVGIA